MSRTSISLPEALKRRVNELAKERGMNTSEYIRRALDLAIESDSGREGLFTYKIKGRPDMAMSVDEMYKRNSKRGIRGKAKKNIK